MIIQKNREKRTQEQTPKQIISQDLVVSQELKVENTPKFENIRISEHLEVNSDHQGTFPSLDISNSEEEDDIDEQQPIQEQEKEIISSVRRLRTLASNVNTPGNFLKKRVNQLVGKLRVAANMIALRKRLEKDKLFFHKNMWVLSLIDDKQVQNMVGQLKVEKQLEEEEARRRLQQK